MDGVRIAEDPRFGSGDMVSASKTLVRVRILPALFGRFEVARVLLEEPDISVVRSTDGWNLAALGAPDVPEKQLAEPSAAPPIAIALLDIDGGTIRYADHTSKPPAEITVRNVEFRASDLSFGEELRFELAAAMFDPEEHDVKASGTVGPIDADDIDAAPVDVVVHIEDLDTVRALALIGGVDGMEANGPLTASIHAGGTVATWTAHLSVHAEAARIRYGTAIDKAAGSTLSLAATLASDGADGYRAAPFAITVGDSEIDGEASVKATPAGTSSFDAKLESAGLALADLGAVSPAIRDARVEGLANLDLRIRGDAAAGLRSADGSVALENVAATPAGAPPISQIGGRVVFRGKAVEIAPTTFRVGGAPATLEGSVADISQPALAFTLTSARLPLSALSTGSEDASGDVLEDLHLSGTARSGSNGPIVAAKLNAKRGKLGGLPLSNLAATLSHEAGVSRVEPMSFTTAGGQVRGMARYAAPESPGLPPHVRMRAQATGVDVERLTAALTAASVPLAGGKISFDIDADGRGSDWDTLSRALSGDGNFSWLGGTLRETNVPEAALQGITGIPGLSALLPAGLRKDFPSLFGRKDTSFEKLAAKFRIQDGRVTTKDLGMDAKDFAIRADGSVGLDWTTDLQAMLKASPDLSRRLIGEVGALRHLADAAGRVAIPFRMTGALTGPKIQPDTAALASSLQKGLVGSLSEQLFGGKGPKLPNLAPKAP